MSDSDGIVAFETADSVGTTVAFEFPPAAETQFEFADESFGLLPTLASAD